MYLEITCHTTHSISVPINSAIVPLVAPSTNFFITALQIKSLFPAISYLSYPGIVEVRVFLSKPVVDRFHLLPEGLLVWIRSEEHTSELQSRGHLVCRLLLEQKYHEIP